MLEDVIPAHQAGLPTFPTWPPPSGGLPIVAPELGPILATVTYGQGQTAKINTATVAPLPLARAFPKIMPPLNGANQKQLLPTWPHAKFNALPHKADPALSKLP